ncbi:MAG: hypothetical protein ACE5J0_03435, partial [Candidatus Paceibacterales bacterium]
MTEIIKSGLKISLTFLFLGIVFGIGFYFFPSNQNYSWGQDFAFGVLAINTNKSIYISDKQQGTSDTAYIQIAALDDNGQTICDAELELRITNQELGIETTFSTEEGTIQKSADCGVDNITEKPDYFAYYQVGEPGTYQMKLTNLDTGYEITDSF